MQLHTVIIGSMIPTASQVGFRILIVFEGETMIWYGTLFSSERVEIIHSSIVKSFVFDSPHQSHSIHVLQQGNICLLQA